MSIKQILAQIGVDQDPRWDAKATAMIDQDLEDIREKTYDIEYPDVKARMFIPVDNTVDPGAETVSYRQWDMYGMADMISNYADDIGLVDAKAEKFTQNIESLGKAYQYSIQDLRRAAFSGQPLEMRRARAARGAIERRIDDIAATGNAPTKMKGLLNHSNVTILTAANDGTATEWTTGRATPKTSANIVRDMNTSVANIFTTTKEVHKANAILLDTTNYQYINQQAYGSDSDRTILRWFLLNNPNITMVDSWYKLDTADAAGTGPRMVCYERSEDVLQLVIPQEFEQFPPQARNLAFVVPCHARCGGVVIYYPLAVVYMDGI